MSIQILQYEFLGPVSLGEWGPPMEKVVYLILGRDKDSFRMLYAGDCEKTDEKAFFVGNPAFKCWASQAGSEKSLYLAILPLFESTGEQRARVTRKIIAHYKPACNDEESPAAPPYRVGSKEAEPPGPKEAEPPGPKEAEPPGPKEAEPPGPKEAEPPGPKEAEPPGPKEAEPPGPKEAEPPGPKVHCPCCGSEMEVERVLEKTTVIRCSGCGISDTRLNP